MKAKHETYHAIGSVRGSCGHRHRSLRTACKCLRKDELDCESVGGYSDRHIERTDETDLSEYDLDFIRFYS